MGKTQRRAQIKGGSNKNAKNNDQASEDSNKSRKGGKGGRKGRGSWTAQLETELSNLGLRVHEVAADGSCFFRSLADQLQGQSGDHCLLRKTIVQHIKENREIYEPFIEDDEPFDNYMDRMAEEGTWAGNLELQAASMQLKVNLKIYQAGQPPWVVKNFPEDAPTLHLSYHDGMHYNSVRLLEDYGTGPPELIPINGIRNSSTNSNGVGSGSSGNRYSENDLRRVKDGTGCEDDVIVVRVLEKVNGDVDAAIEALVEELHGEGSGGSDGVKIEEGIDSKCPQVMKTTVPLVGDFLNKIKCGSDEEKLVEVELIVSRGGKGKRVKVYLHIVAAAEEENIEDNKQETIGEDKNDDGEVAIAAKKKSKMKAKGDKNQKEKSRSSLIKEMPPSRNSRCPCGSTKKYKNCCGASKAARARTQNTITSNGAEVEEDTGSNAAEIGAAMGTLYI